MRKTQPIIAAVALGLALTLSACHKQEQAASTQTATLARPGSIGDTAAWNKYLGQLVAQNAGDFANNNIYPYMVPAGDNDAAKAEYQRQLQSVQGVIARTVLPGNLLVFAGPSSAITAKFVGEAFTGAQANSFKGVTVMFIGDKADEATVQKDIAASGATFKFVQM